MLITFSETFPRYELAVADSTRKRSFLAEELEKLGFSNADIKTLCFDVKVAYESYRDKNKDWCKRFEGYKYTHRMKLEFSRDNELLGKVLYVLTHCQGEPEFEICYTVSEPDKIKNELLEKISL